MRVQKALEGARVHTLWGRENRGGGTHLQKPPEPQCWPQEEPGRPTLHRLSAWSNKAPKSQVLWAPHTPFFHVLPLDPPWVYLIRVADLFSRDLEANQEMWALLVPKAPQESLGLQE